MTPVRIKALELAEGLPPTASNLTKVGNQTNPEAARWAFEQWSLRERGRAKFRFALKMLFDREALEMATHERVAEYHASRFLDGALVEDWTVGIGSDLIALAARGPAIGYEVDLERAAMALHNISARGLEAEIFRRDALKDAREVEYAFCDPARRAGGKRTLDLSQFSPDPRKVASAFVNAKLGGIKLSPLLSDHELESFGGRLEFVSFGGECREALVWLGAEAGSGRFAVHVESGESLPAVGDAPWHDEPDTYLWEADPAAIRAHCLGALCNRLHLRAVGDSNGYLTSAHLVSSPWLRGFQVLASHRADLKRTAAELRRLGGSTPVVKSRASAIDVAQLAKKLTGSGEELVLLVYPVGKSLQHVIARRL